MKPTPLRRRTELMRRVPLRNRGTKARRDEVEMHEAEKDMGPRVCAAQPALEHLCVGRPVRHHVRRRGQGGSNDASNLIWLCPWAHQWVHSNTTEAKERGWLR